jgi:bifunctional lysine-specific demethylase and histidyl-hydroxylase NO66
VSARISATRRSGPTSSRRSARRPPTRTWTTPTPTRTTLTATPTTRTPRGLERCVDPVGAREFLEDYWERRPLAIERHEEGRFDDLLSEADVEQIVCSGGLRYPGFRLVKAGEQLRARDYTVDIPWRPTPFTGTADVEKVLAEWERGATVVLQGLHLTRPAVGEFCRSLEAALGHPAQANAYYTPRNAQGLPVHHDTHDVFVLQVAGEKRWRVYDPAFELPLKNQRYSADLGAPGETVEDRVLGPGDTLYLPRGWLHEAVTSQTDSLHLTIGVNVVTWLDAFKAALEELGDDVRFRRSWQAGDGVDELVEALRGRLGRDDVERRARDRLVRTRRPLREGQMRQLRGLEELGLDTELERRSSVIADLVAGDGSVSLVFEGRELTFPGHVRRELEAVFGAEQPFTPAELPGALDDPSRLVLVRRLVREGFLTIRDA